MHARRIGEVLVEAGYLNATQVDEVLDKQATSSRSFGQIAGELFGVPASVVAECVAVRVREDAKHVNLAHESFEQDALATLAPATAWDHLVLPIRFDGNELICATTKACIRDAVETLQTATTTPFRLVVADVRPLEEFIAEAYGFEGIDLADADANAATISAA
ncbi:MAG: hypothetical protein AAF078_08930 [Planctomycetota bacterium]